MKSPPAYPIINAKAELKPFSKVNPTPLIAQTDNNPIIPEAIIVPTKYPGLNFTSLYENWCLIKPTKPLMKPPPKADIKIMNIIF